MYKNSAILIVCMNGTIFTTKNKDLTSGSLGIPGVCLLYGILVYQSL